MADTSPGVPSRFFVTVDVVLFKETEAGLEVLLVERGSPPFAGARALPGGFVETDEPLVEAAVRELAEETSVQLATEDLHQFGVYGDPGRDPRGRTITVAYWATSGTTTPRAGSDAASADFVSVEGLSAEDLAFDHDVILRDAITRMRDVPD